MGMGQSKQQKQKPTEKSSLTGKKPLGIFAGQGVNIPSFPTSGYKQLPGNNSNGQTVASNQKESSGQGTLSQGPSYGGTSTS